MQSFTNLPFFLLRTPACSIDLLDGLPDDPADFLKAFFSRPAAGEALFLASPDLYDQFIKWSSAGTAQARVNEKMINTLLKYFIRICSRPTPYGLFGGCCIGSLSDQPSSIELSDNNKSVKEVRLDLMVADAVGTAMGNITEIRDNLLFTANQSICRVGDQYRYVETKRNANFRFYKLSSAEYSSYLMLVIKKAEHPKRIDELAGEIMLAEPDVSLAEAKEYIEELISSRILVSELELNVTGENYFDRLVNRIRELVPDSTEAATLNEVHQLLKEQTHNISTYHRIAELLKPYYDPGSLSNMFHADLKMTPSENVINQHVIDQLSSELRDLWAFSSRSSIPELEQLKRRFIERYENQEVPLLMLLDPDIGLGYERDTQASADITPLLDGIQWRTGGGEKKGASIFFERLQQFRMKKLYQVLGNGDYEMVISPEDIEEVKGFAIEEPNLPESFYAIGTLLSESSKSLDAGDFRFLIDAMAGPSLANLMGRFAIGNPELEKLLKDGVADDQKREPDVIYAEIAHFSQSRVGNILMRPHLRNYEIPYLATTTLPPLQVISLDDLMVSVVNNQVVLRSKRLGKRVIPRLSNAHNFNHASLPIYKFLCQLQFQDLNPSFFWDWGGINEPFLPRVLYKNIIIQPASWQLDWQMFDKEDQDHYDQLKNIQSQFRIPNLITMADRDNHLYLDLTRQACIRILLEEIKKKGKLLVREFLSTPDRQFIKSGELRYTNEVVIPFQTLKTNAVRYATAGQSRTIEVPSSFAIGSEWLYVKVYSGTKTADQILGTVIPSIVQKLYKIGMISKFFFIRYNDPEHHLRLRFYNNQDPGFWKEVLDLVAHELREYSANGLISKIQVDTYKRELERYGASTMDLSEEFFSINSQSVLRIQSLLADEQQRWLCAIRAIDNILDIFSYDTNSRTTLLKTLYQSYFLEHSGNTKLKVQLNDKYRLFAPVISRVLTKPYLNNELPQQIHEIFDHEKEMWIKAIESAGFNPAAGAGSHFHPGFVSSHIHMCLNRFFISKSRRHELVAYCFMMKYYESLLARERAKFKPHFSDKENVVGS